MNVNVIVLAVCISFFTTALCDADYFHRNSRLVSRHEGDKEEVSVSKRACYYRVSWQAHGEEVTFSLRTTVPSPQQLLWAAVGLSTTREMPDTQFVSCWVAANQIVELMSGVTTDHSGVKILNNNESEVDFLEGGWTDGELHCNFTWRITTSQPLYLILATGPLSVGNGVSMRKHNSRPTVTRWELSEDGSDKDGELAVDCNCHSIWSEVLIRIHGGFMAVAFLLMIPTGIVTARHYKSTFQANNRWFKVHVRIMVYAVCFVLLALVLALVHTKGALHKGVHQIFGVLLIVLVLLQPLVALFRPRSIPLTIKRRVFNIFHRTLGITIFCAGVIQCFLGVYILQVRSKGVLYGFLVLSAIGHGIFVIIYEYIHFRLRQRTPTAHYSKALMEDSDGENEEVAFMDSARSTASKNLAVHNSSQKSLHMNALHYVFLLQAFTVTGLFNAFLFYEIS